VWIRLSSASQQYGCPHKITRLQGDLSFQVILTKSSIGLQIDKVCIDKQGTDNYNNGYSR
jgi:hypothetical protein